MTTATPAPSPAARSQRRSELLTDTLIAAAIGLVSGPLFGTFRT